MIYERIVLKVTIAFSLVCLAGNPSLSQNSSRPQSTDGPATIEEVVKAGRDSVARDDWAGAESHFRKAAKLEPAQALWRIQLFMALAQQKKWKEAFKEVETVIVKLNVADWVLTINKKLPDGKLVYLNTEIFGDEQRGLSRYVKAVKENKNVDSVARDVGVKLDEFAKLNNIALMYDISKLKNKPFVSGKIVDVTSEFIAFYNGRYKN
jgi:hypothetical protein